MPQVLRASVGLAILLLSTPLAACSGRGNDVVATVNGQPISRSEYNTRLENLPKAHLLLQRLVESALIEQYATQNHLEVSDADIAARIAYFRAQFPGDSWNKMLAVRDLNQSELQTFFREQIILDRVVAKDVNVTQADVATYYAQHHAQFDRPGKKATLEDARPQIVEKLREQQEFPWSEQFIDDLRKKADIKVYDPRFIPLFPSPPPVPPGAVETTPKTE